MIETKKLQTAAKELNTALGLDPKINLKAKAKELETKIKEASELIEDDDEFSDVTTEVLAILVPTEEEEAPKKGKKGKKAPAPVEDPITKFNKGILTPVAFKISKILDPIVTAALDPAAILIISFTEAFLDIFIPAYIARLVPALEIVILETYGIGDLN